MKQVGFFIGIILLIINMPLLSADLITPGYTPIEINNYITNVNDFPDYVFVTVGRGPMCSIEVVKEGVIEGQYKFCSLSVYAVEKNKFNESNIPDGESQNYNQDVETYLTSISAIKVIDDVSFYDEVPVSSSHKVINNYYTIDLNQVKLKPDKVGIERNYLIYAYIIIPIIVLLIIIFIIYRRSRK